MMIYMTVKLNISGGMANHTHTLIIAIGLLLAQGFSGAQAAEPEKVTVKHLWPLTIMQWMMLY